MLSFGASEGANASQTGLTLVSQQSYTQTGAEHSAPVAQDFTVL